jgi:hypothetical protein
MPMPTAQAADRFLDFAFADVRRAAISTRIPNFDMAAMADMVEADAAPEFTVPEMCETWMPIPAAQAAERFLDFAFADARPAEIPTRMPRIGDLPVVSTFVRDETTYAPCPRPEPVTAGVWPVPDNTPIAYGWPLAQLRFALHAVDEVGPGAPVATHAPAPADALPGLQPMPVETMPSVPAFAASALPMTPSMRTPWIGCITAQVLPQARAVAGPAPEALETMPRVARLQMSALPARPALRFPTLAHFQPAADPAEPLASPVTAPGPAPVETMPSFAAFAAMPRPAAPPVLARAFEAELRAEFPFPRVPLPAPAIAEPPVPVAQPAALDPLSRIAAQPAGGQPERPKPAIPCPGIIPLEFYSHRIASSPVKRIEVIETRIAVTPPPFAIAPALGRLEDLLNKKARVLPFAEIFAKKPGAGRAKISLMGKIAATIMVGLSLWTGSRVANLSQHTEALRAEVAASERTVTVAESHDLNGNFGNGPLGKMRRAIADRAATEITDSFKGGMTAWGAQPKTLAAGWKRHPEGYVSIGDMALFQPSIQYTDYRMEFYGQIEEKSMNWVVRAADKKNYYAMKFKVIEAGLRPIIAMVHYGVVNGKAGHTVETPLSVMVHNNQPYHVAVDVRGNHFTASIEGETVESWTDDSAARGGVGFFADAGEKARLYWMRLSRNQDWLGRVCAYMSGDGRSRQQTAELWGPEIPPEKPEPARPRGADLAVAAGVGIDNWNSPGRAKTGKQRRSEAWIS